MIATITFHWGNNYGAVLQAYALQTYIHEIGYESEIIQYIPRRIRLMQIAMHLMKREFSLLNKDFRIGKFRKKELRLSKKKYFTNKALKKCASRYDKVICGSDQVWNESFIHNAEGKPVLSYYLDFCDTDRIAYAVSFGTEKLSEKTEKLVFPELEKFKSIGVRENTGKDMVNRMGLPATVVLDPTLLLEREDYEKLLSKQPTTQEEKVFTYVLHGKQETAIQICNFFKRKYGEETEGKYYAPTFGIYEWLNRIKNAELVVTNSFHGTTFSILFQKDFIVVPVEGSAMNDRIFSLLNAIGLEDRIVSKYDEAELENVINRPIPWEEVNEKLRSKKEESKQFLIEALKQQ